MCCLFFDGVLLFIYCKIGNYFSVEIVTFFRLDSGLEKRKAGKPFEGRIQNQFQNSIIQVLELVKEN